MRSIRVGLLGFGVVGTGVVRLLLENRDLLSARLGADLVLGRIADIDTTRDRGVGLPEGLLVADGDSVVGDPEIDIVVELIGGEKAAKTFMMKAIGAGKPVVTANKALLAAHGNEIFRAAAEKLVDLGYEAAVGGCMPIIKCIRESLAGNRIHSMVGILNGTCNYILSKITDEGCSFEDALAQAQRNGFAEADPGLDVDGYNTAHKLAILTAIAYGMEINLADIYREGISHITPMDIGFAGQFGYRIKLLAIGKHLGDSVEARVHPTMIPKDNILSSVNANLNAVTLTGDAVGDMLLCGYGAGMLPTASAVVSDLVDIARNLLASTPSRIPLLSYRPEGIRRIPILPIDRLQTHYYIRFFAVDRPGVLSRIAGVLGHHDISIKSVHQKGRKLNGAVPLVMLTHRSREADSQAALGEFGSLDIISGRPVLIRIEDENGSED